MARVLTRTDFIDIWTVIRTHDDMQPESMHTIREFVRGDMTFRYWPEWEKYILSKGWTIKEFAEEGFSRSLT